MRPTTPPRRGSTVELALHHLKNRWPIGEKPDDALLALCGPCLRCVHQLHAKHPHRSLEAITRSAVRRRRLRSALRA